MTDGVKSALDQGLELGASKDISQQIGAGNSGDAAQPLGADRIDEHEGQHAACHGLVGIELAKDAHERINVPLSESIGHEEEGSDAKGNERHLDSEGMLGRELEVVLEP